MPLPVRFETAGFRPPVWRPGRVARGLVQNETSEQDRRRNRENAQIDQGMADMEAIADYIAHDKPDAATRYVQQVFAAVERLMRFPKSGVQVPEIPHLPHRQVVVPQCRVFYRLEGKDIVIVFVVRRYVSSLRPLPACPAGAEG